MTTHIACLLCLLFCSLASSFRDRAEYPTIQDVVSFKTGKQPTKEAGDSEVTIDIEKLDIRRIKNDDTAFRHQLMGGFGGDLLLQDDKQTRRAGDLKNWKKMKSPELTRTVQEIKFRTQMADNMLQLIYMARSKVRSFETQGFVNQESSEYRVGTVISRLDGFFYKARRYYTIMLVKQNEGKWINESTSILNLHHKIVMAHTDFTHFYFLITKMHERLNQIHGRPIHIIGLLSQADSKKVYPMIQDVVSFSERGNMDLIYRLVKDIKGFIDIDKFHTDRGLFRRQIRGNLEDTVLLEGKPIKSRRVQTYLGSNQGYEDATYLQFRTKVADCMLQLVYMARHFIKIFERKKKVVDTTSNVYRIGLLVRKLTSLYKKSKRILEILNVKQQKDLWVRGNSSAPAITLHHKVAKIHVDFIYYYEVLKRLHAKHRELIHYPREKPPYKRDRGVL